jgi:hypothetical protein
MKFLNNQEGLLGSFMGLLSLVITLLIICFLFQLTMKAYFKPLSKDVKAENKIFSQTGIDTSNYKTILESTREKINTISSQQNQILHNLTQVDN